MYLRKYNFFIRVCKNVIVLNISKSYKVLCNVLFYKNFSSTKKKNLPTNCTYIASA